MCNWEKKVFIGIEKITSFLLELDGASTVDFSNKDSEDSRILHAFSMSFARYIALAVKKQPCQVDDSK